MPNTQGSSSSPPSAYVYPARSLLSSSIQPASQPTTDDVATRTMVDIRSRQTSAPTDSRPPHKRTSTTLTAAAITPRRPRSVSDSSVSPTPAESPKKNRRKRRQGSNNTPNFRHFPGEAGPSTLPRKFSATNSAGPAELTPDSLAVLSTSTSIAYVASPSESPSTTITTPPEPRARPKQVPVSDDPLPPEEVPDAPDASFLAPWNTDIVHLPPLPTSSGAASHSERSVAIYPRLPSSLGSRERSASRSSTSQLRQDSEPPENQGNKQNKLSNSSQTSLSNGISGSVSGSASGSDASDLFQFMTVRFQHSQDDHGHHVIIGREGKLSRCEDEASFPIRTPGAVQGFGVLIAVEELDDTLLVRQVSENAEELLGLPPHFLFSLECFTDTLPESQIGVIWDNLQFLSETDLNAQDEEGSPHVFLLTGWGAPGSAKNGDLTANGDRRVWTCWCAVHRPSDPSGNADTSIIIMEFELERDTLNPLYPPISEDTGATLGTPGSVGSGSGGGTDGTGTERGASTDGSATLMPSRNGSSNDLGPTLFVPSAEDILESTTSRAKPLPALERLRRIARGERPPTSPSSTPSDPLGAPQGLPLRSRRTRRGTGPSMSGGVGMMDVFAVMAQINEQLGDAPDLNAFLQVVVGVIKDLSQFHRVLVYQFDESWNGQVVAELMEWSKTHDLYRGLHFPAADIPAQARQLYGINKVRLLYDRSQATARIVVRNREDLKTPLNMTHCYLRAMSPIHVKYLENMGVRASMSVSIMAFGALWGLVSCHSYGSHGMRVSFPVRQMLRLLSQSISRNIERLSYAQRLTTRKLINTMATDNHPTGYIVSNADDLLGLFDADFGVLVIGQAAKMLGPNDHGQEILVMTEYLRLKQFTTIQVSQGVTIDFEDLALLDGLDVLAGMLYVPLSSEGKDFICFLRKGQPRHVHWAGNPNLKSDAPPDAVLQPRKSFAIWSETLAGRCRAWTDEQLETAGVLALVYGKFIEVWRQKENALQTTRLTNLLLSNASHEVRTPLNHIINYLELALNGQLDDETRDNLNRSHAASKSLLFTINDLLDLTRLESGNETSFNEPFDLQFTIEDATHLYRKEAQRRNLDFRLDLDQSPKTVVGDAKKIRTVVQNLTANSLKYTTEGYIMVGCMPYDEPEGLRSSNQTAVEIVVADTGCGIPPERLSSIFRDFEQVEWAETKTNTNSSTAGVGLGLAVVARIVEQLGGQLRVESKVNEGSRFSFLIPLSLSADGDGLMKPRTPPRTSSNNSSKSLQVRSRQGSLDSSGEIDSLVEALASNHMLSPSPTGSSSHRRTRSSSPESLPLVPPHNNLRPGIFGVSDSSTPLRPIKVDGFTLDTAAPESNRFSHTNSITASPDQHILADILPPSPKSSKQKKQIVSDTDSESKLRVLIVEDDEINRMILAKRLRLDGHDVVTTTNGQEGLDKVTGDREYDAILMDIQMPILDGYQATERIRTLEKEDTGPNSRVTSQLNGGHIPIFAVSASLQEKRRDELANYGVDGWILKPIDFKRLKVLLNGVTDPDARSLAVYTPGCSWEAGGWLGHPPPS
ncbi:ATP-binding cassette transporter [Mycena indigotica]|uniref:ATP-binding cassette transporter n=1 Tax=Mycena indigotica TaxID=2126181 RepID=A0A8H6VZ92_9AGAR|nr:ATP-binding cassette transporter [Mycena indigotica]KAF7299237.1 ATP-binding cassette transporter [Mycena indigotica]